METKQGDIPTSSKSSKLQGNIKKEELLEYIKELEQKQSYKSMLLKKNQNCVKTRLNPDTLAKLDSSLKKNTAFVKKLRNFTASQLDTLLKDFSGLNLTKYLSEVVVSLTEAKLKLTDITAVTALCTELNCSYGDFSPLFHEQWIKTLCIKKDEPITNPRKFNIDLRFYSELVACGVFSQREALPLLGTILTVITSDKKYSSLSIVISFCKHCGDDFAGLLPHRIRKLSDQFCIPVPCSSLLSGEKQANVRALFKDYYLSLSQHLQKEVKRIQMFEKQSKQLLNTKGELRQERIMKEEVLLAEFQTLLAGALNLAELLDLAPPDLPVTSCCEDSSLLLDTEECVGGNIWEDEETRLFYTEFPQLQDYLPQVPNKNTEENVSKNIFAELEEMYKESVNDSNIKENGNKDESKKEDVIEEQEANFSKSALETFLKHLPSCTNKEMIDNAAVEFLLYLNSKNGRKKLIFTLFTVHRTRLDLLPLYARLVAILYPAIPEIGYNLSQQLKAEVHRQIQKKDQVYIESKIRSIRFIGELVNMQVFAKHDVLQVLKLLLQDFTHHHIEMACNLLETCGRFLYRSFESHHRTKAFLEQMMRVKSMMVLDTRYVYMIENTYYLVNPPETVYKCQTKPVQYQFLDKIVFQDLMQPGCEQTVLHFLRCMDWECENTVAYIIKCLSSPHKIKFQRIRALADLVAQLAEYQEVVASHIVDTVLEDIRLGMEANIPIMNQRRVAMVKYLGELYTYRLLDNNDIFKVLYSMLTFGISMDHNNPSTLDPPLSVFRIKLIIILLETCVPFFFDYCSRQKLNCFFTYFQSYYWFKRTSPVWTREVKFPQVIQQMFADALTSMCPLIKPAKSYIEAQQAVKQLSDKILSDLLNNDRHNGELEACLECIDEEEETGSEDTEQKVNKTGIQNTIYNEMIEDMDFLTALDQMFLDNVRLRDKVKHTNVDISIPITHKKELAEQESNFVLILKKGNKQQFKTLEMPADSELVINLKTREEEERREMEKMKQITLDINQRIQEEAMDDIAFPK